MKNILAKVLFIKNVISTFVNWPLYFLAFSGFLNGRKFEFHIRGNYGKVIKILVPVDSLSRVPLQEVWVSKSYCFPGFEINRHDTVVDIGAHIGNFTVYAAEKAFEGKVLAYEPSVENFNLLRLNIQLNSLRNVTVFNLGMSDGAGEKELHISGNSVSPSLFQSFKGGGFSYRVKVIGIKEAFIANGLDLIDFLKIDAEGAEYEILFNVPKFFLDKIGKIVLEYHEGVFTKYGRCDLENFLRRNSFEISTRPLPASRTGIIYAWRRAG